MKSLLSALVFILIATTSVLAAAKGPEVDMVDNKLSINAEAVSIGRLLQLVDRATGMKSKVPAELANRNISVKLSGLNVTDAVRKMFQGQPLDYIMVEGQGIIVTAVSQTTPGGDSSLPAYNPQPAVQQYEQPFVQEFPPVPPVQIQPGQQQQPAMIQTPFGQIPNPRAQQQPTAPLTTPGQQNSLFPSTAQPNTQPQVGFPGSQQIGSPTPFGTPSTFGTPNQPVNQNNGLFGNTPVLGAGSQPR